MNKTLSRYKYAKVSHSLSFSPVLCKEKKNQNLRMKEQSVTYVSVVCLLQVQFKVVSKFNNIKLVYYGMNQITIISVKIHELLKNVSEKSFNGTIDSL
jgi:hypothetical protein